MNVSNFDEATGNESEVVRTRLSEAEGAVETAKHEWKAAKRGLWVKARCLALLVFQRNILGLCGV